MCYVTVSPNNPIHYSHLLNNCVQFRNRSMYRMEPTRCLYMNLRGTPEACGAYVVAILVKGRFTLSPKVERPLISTNHIARNQEFGLSTLHTMAKVQRPSQFKMIIF
jgi:hypothetical protein